MAYHTGYAAIENALNKEENLQNIETKCVTLTFAELRPSTLAF